MINNYLTVVIPTYNRSQFLAEAITSVLNQSYQNFQILVSDNASKDDTESVVKSFNDDRIIYIKHKTNMGMQRNWEFALKYPKDGLVALLEDDNYWKKDHLNEAVRAFDKYHSANFYCCASIILQNDNESMFKPYWINGDDVVFWDPYLNGLEAFVLRTPFAASSLVIKREAINHINFQEGYDLWSMDFLWWTYLAVLQGGFTLNPMPQVYYRAHIESISSVLGNDPKTSIKSRKTLRLVFSIVNSRGLLSREKLKEEIISNKDYYGPILLSALINYNSTKEVRKIGINLYKETKEFFKNSTPRQIQISQKVGYYYFFALDTIDFIRSSIKLMRN